MMFDLKEQKQTASLYKKDSVKKSKHTVLWSTYFNNLIWLMYLEKKNQNKYTIGKYLRRIKGLRQKDQKAKRIPLNQ